MKSAMRLLLWLFVAATPAHAQETSALPGVLRVADNRGWHLRVVTGGGEIEGRVRGVDSDSARIDDTTIALADVTRIERRIRAGGGAAAGAIAGGAVGGLAFLPLAGLCQGDCTSETIAIFAIGVGVGASLGAMIGGIAVPGDVTWELEWRREP